MNPQWWSPGKEFGLLSQRWIQVLVIPLPNLSVRHIDASLRFKMQSMLPTNDVPISTRWFRNRHRLYGVAIAHRMKELPKDVRKLRIGVPFILPGDWPNDCFLALRTPDGWDLHWYENRILSKSYPPFKFESAIVHRYLADHPDSHVLAFDPQAPEADLEIQWATPPPSQRSPATLWGPWIPRPPSRWPWVVGSFFLFSGVIVLFAAYVQIVAGKTERNELWRHWIQKVQILIGEDGLSNLKKATLRESLGLPLFEILHALHLAWGSEVAIQRLDVRDGKFLLTARCSSALVAVERLSTIEVPFTFRLLQIRPVVGMEEFDVEGELTK